MVALLRIMSGLVALALSTTASSSSFGSQRDHREFQCLGVHQHQTPPLLRQEVIIGGNAAGLRRSVVIHRTTTNAQGEVVVAHAVDCAANEELFNDACACGGVCGCGGLPNLPKSGAEEHLEVLEDDVERGSEYLTLLRAAIGLGEPVTTQETRWQKLEKDHPRTTVAYWMSRDLRLMMSGVTIDRLGIFFLRGRGGECTLLNKNFRITSVLFCRSGGPLCWTLQSSMFSEERILRSMQHGVPHGKYQHIVFLPVIIRKT